VPMEWIYTTYAYVCCLVSPKPAVRRTVEGIAAVCTLHETRSLTYVAQVGKAAGHITAGHAAPLTLFHHPCSSSISHHRGSVTTVAQGSRQNSLFSVACLLTQCSLRRCGGLPCGSMPNRTRDKAAVPAERMGLVSWREAFSVQRR